MKKLFSDYNIEVNNEQVEKFDNYYRLLIEWNKKINLTAIINYEDVIKKHFLDSVLLLKVYTKVLLIL